MADSIPGSREIDPSTAWPFVTAYGLLMVVLVGVFIWIFGESNPSSNSFQQSLNATLRNATNAAKFRSQ